MFSFSLYSIFQGFKYEKFDKWTSAGAKIRYSSLFVHLMGYPEARDILPSGAFRSPSSSSPQQEAALFDFDEISTETRKKIALQEILKCIFALEVAGEISASGKSAEGETVSVRQHSDKMYIIRLRNIPLVGQVVLKIRKCIKNIVPYFLILSDSIPDTIEAYECILFALQEQISALHIPTAQVTYLQKPASF